MMDYQLLGRTGVKVSPLCFGTMSFGDIADEAESARMFKRCRDVGINFLTAPMSMQPVARKRSWAS